MTRDQEPRARRETITLFPPRCQRALELKAEADRVAEVASHRTRELEQQLQRERWERDDEQRRFTAREQELEERLGTLRAATERADAEARERIADLSAKLQQAESRGSAAEARRVEDLEELARARDAKARGPGHREGASMVTSTPGVV